MKGWAPYWITSRAASFALWLSKWAGRQQMHRKEGPWAGTREPRTIRQVADRIVKKLHAIGYEPDL